MGRSLLVASVGLLCVVVLASLSLATSTHLLVRAQSDDAAAAAQEVVVVNKYTPSPILSKRMLKQMIKSPHLVIVLVHRSLPTNLAGVSEEDKTLHRIVMREWEHFYGVHHNAVDFAVADLATKGGMDFALSSEVVDVPSDTTAYFGPVLLVFGDVDAERPALLSASPSKSEILEMPTDHLYHHWDQQFDIMTGGRWLPDLATQKFLKVGAVGGTAREDL